VLTVIAIFTIDEPLARWIAAHDTHARIWNQGIAWLEVPLGIEPWKWTGVVVLVAGSIATLAIPRLRPAAHAFVLVTLVHLFDRNVTMWMKWGTGRLRPAEWLARGGDVWLRDGGYAFPSGHVMLFASILVPLAVVYPRTRPLLAIVVFAAVARIAVNAHWLSDTLGALALVSLTTWGSSRLLQTCLRR
jgi:membrane-associated phospholipid phosphatase